MHLKRIIGVAAMCVALVGAATPARANDLVYAAGPGGAAGANFPLPVMVIQPGDKLDFLNLDIAYHNVAATQAGPDSTCIENGISFTPGNCPLFISKTVGLGARTPIVGVPSLPSGQYPFVCQPHAGWMKGTLIVL